MSTVKPLQKTNYQGLLQSHGSKRNDDHLSERRTGLVKEDEEHRTYVVSYDDYADDQAWRAEFGAMYQDHQY